MTSVREDLGFSEAPPKFRRAPSVAVYEGVSQDGDRWFGTVLRADGKRSDVYGATKEAAVNRARNLVQALNGNRGTR